MIVYAGDRLFTNRRRTMKTLYYIFSTAIGGFETQVQLLLKEHRRRGEYALLVAPPGAARDFLAQLSDCALDPPAHPPAIVGRARLAL